ncbi:MAG: transposase [Conexivisphaerales archaeon]
MSTITMVKILFFQSLYVKQAEKEIHDRISFMNFLDYPDLLPDSKTILFFREGLSRTGRDNIIWKELQRQLDSKGIKIRIVLLMMLS